MTEPGCCEKCQTQLDTKLVLSPGGNLSSAIRQLKYDLNDCPLCETYDDCPFIAKFNSAVTLALHQVTEEWNLASTQP